MVEEQLKNTCRDYALKIKERNRKFPIQSDWIVKNGFPCSMKKVSQLFGGYNKFRKYCNEPIINRTENISLEWIKSNCTINDNNCWNWNKSIIESGYGQTRYNGKMCLTHRVSYILKYEEDIPENLLIRHKCDNRKCCNPNHLELGTMTDNTNDTLERKKNLKTNNSKLAVESRKYKTLKEKIDFYLKHVNIDDNNCWVSNKLKSKPTGYYQIEFKNKNYRLHRLVLADKLNKEYNEICTARHICHNKSCINPKHLIEGSRSDNSLDSRHYSKVAKLTEIQVRQIKSDDPSGYPFRKDFDEKWAKEFGVSTSCIINIRYNNTWSDIPWSLL